MNRRIMLDGAAESPEIERADIPTAATKRIHGADEVHRATGSRRRLRITTEQSRLMDVGRQQVDEKSIVTVSKLFERRKAIEIDRHEDDGVSLRVTLRPELVLDLHRRRCNDFGEGDIDHATAMAAAGLIFPESACVRRFAASVRKATAVTGFSMYSSTRNVLKASAR